MASDETSRNSLHISHRLKKVTAMVEQPQILTGYSWSIILAAFTSPHFRYTLDKLMSARKGTKINLKVISIWVYIYIYIIYLP